MITESNIGDGNGMEAGSNENSQHTENTADTAMLNTASTSGSEGAANSSAAQGSSVTSSPVPRRRRGGRRVVRVAGAAGAKLPVKVEAAPEAASPNPATPDAAAVSAETVKPTKNVEQHEQRSSEETLEAQPSSSRRRRNASSQQADKAGLEERNADDDEPIRLPARRRTSAAKSGNHRAEAKDEARRQRIRLLADELFTDKGIDAEVESDAADAKPQSEPETTKATAKRSTDIVQFSSPDRGGEVVAPRPRPMTSLLFQEPVLPAVRPAKPDNSDEQRDEREIGEEESRSHEQTRTRRRRRRGAAHDEDGLRSELQNEAAQSDQQDRDDHADREGVDNESHRRRSRRLNAQERRAAAEVEQIEHDLEYDEITYTPIDTEEGDHGKEQAETRSRRRRRRSHDEEGESRHSRREREREEDEEENTVTRRRRRRRSKSDESREEPQIRRSRKQQYIDEITDIEGSTRLEAKKQRRRDNRRDRSRQSTLLEQDFLARRENVNRLMVVREKEKHTQISVIEDSILVEHYVSDIQEVSTVGNIYLGRVQNVLPSMEAAFVDIGQPRNGVLYAGEVNWDTTRLEGQPRRIELAFRSGDPVLVQVTKDPIGHKGARLTSQVTLAGRFLVLVPSGGMTGVSRKLPERERTRLKSIVSKIAPKDMGVIIRTAADGASKEAIEKDLESLSNQWKHIQEAQEKARNSKRPKLLQGEPDVAIRVVRDIFNDDFNRLVVEGDKVYDRIKDYLETMAPDLESKLEKWNPEEHKGQDVFDQWRIDSQLRKGMERKVYLPSGGSLVIDRTEAMTTIDVNTGRFIGKGKSLEETVTRCNLEASEEIARQLRLRDIGGMVMIDYVDMVMPANRDLVLRRLVECLARDRTKHQVAEVTSLGLVQMTRKRVGQGLVEAFSEECPTCKGRGFILHDEPTVSASYDDPYALKGGDPFIKTNKHNRGTELEDKAAPQGSSPEVKAKLAKIAAAAAKMD